MCYKETHITFNTDHPLMENEVIWTDYWQHQIVNRIALRTEVNVQNNTLLQQDAEMKYYV
jgi:hypothetical protein